MHATFTTSFKQHATYQRTSGQHARAACLVFTWGMKTTVDRMGVKEESPLLEVTQSSDTSWEPKKMKGDM